ncbi:hypothetical protein CDAR_13191 [Caerostris darwini]|uniref:Ribosomal protein L6 n=1 Tax=Caerostris darwini TaxID=1538125 RepID=A0AAV4R4Z2_9ARAC|nr:hypothetical protein CDAR_13191 [Caerostris darwini]
MTGEAFRGRFSSPRAPNPNKRRDDRSFQKQFKHSPDTGWIQILLISPLSSTVHRDDFNKKKEEKRRPRDVCKGFYFKKRKTSSIFRNKRKRGESRAVRHRSVFIPPPRALSLSGEVGKAIYRATIYPRKRSTKEHFVSLYDRRSLSWSILFAAGLQPKKETRRQTLSKTVQTPPPAQGEIQRLLISLPYTVPCADFKKIKKEDPEAYAKGFHFKKRKT